VTRLFLAALAVLLLAGCAGSRWECHKENGEVICERQ